MNVGRRLAVGCVATALAGSAIAVTPPAAAVSPDRTGAAESRVVDAVPTPRLGWSACFEIAECATVELPLDYDRPRGATTTVGVLRIKARDQANRIGSLFVNPGGPASFSGQGQTFAERRGKQLPPAAAPRSMPAVR